MVRLPHHGGAEPAGRPRVHGVLRPARDRSDTRGHVDMTGWDLTARRAVDLRRVASALCR
ncbi:putative leader peptide [Cellulomonas sp. C5510]|uniref:putative leader peptide n=1 Tax=Cellulomonas sp. C5510 TaxID=2871170 RepID=UPI00351CE0A4